jgi:hypothetical protein
VLGVHEPVLRRGVREALGDVVERLLAEVQGLDPRAGEVFGFAARGLAERDRCSPASPARLIAKMACSGAMIALPPPLSSIPVICVICRDAGSLETMPP